MSETRIKDLKQYEGDNHGYMAVDSALHGTGKITIDQLKQKMGSSSLTLDVNGQSTVYNPSGDSKTVSIDAVTHPELQSATRVILNEVSNEVSAREAGDANLGERIVTVANDLEQGLASEAERADAAIAATELKLEGEIGTEKGARKAADTALETALEAETLARSTADVALEGQLEAAEERLTDAISTETAARENADTTLSGEIDALEGELTAESAARESADTTLSGKIDALEGDLTAESAARESADTTLSGEIDALEGELTAETTARENADTSLGGRIDTVEQALTDEITDREDGDTDLGNRIDGVEGDLALETAAREAADTALGQRIDAIGSPLTLVGSGTPAEIAALQNVKVGSVYSVTAAGSIGTLEVKPGDEVAMSTGGWIVLGRDIEDNSWKQWSEDNSSSGSNDSIYIGSGTTVAGHGSIAVGNENVLDSESNSASVFGKDNTLTGGTGSNVIGTGNTINGMFNVVVGNTNTLNSGNGFVVGTSNGMDNMSGQSVQIYGDENGLIKSTHDYVAGSYNSLDDAFQSTVVGRSNDVKDTQFLAIIGDDNETDDVTNAAISGKMNTVTGSDWVGVSGYNNTVKNAGNSAVMGDSMVVEGDRIAVFGACSTANGDKNSVVLDESTVTGSYNSIIGTGTTVTGSTNVGAVSYAPVTGDNNSVLTRYNAVTGSNNVVSGQYGSVVGDDNISIGQRNTVSRDDATVIGKSNTVSVNNEQDYSGTDLISVGDQNTFTNAANAYSIGRENSVSGNNLANKDTYPHSMAMNLGRNNSITGEGVNLGKDNHAEVFGINIGQGNDAFAASISIGENLKTTTSGIAIGTALDVNYSQNTASLPALKVGDTWMPIAEMVGVHVHSEDIKDYTFDANHEVIDYVDGTTTLYPKYHGVKADNRTIITIRPNYYQDDSRFIDYCYVEYAVDGFDEDGEFVPLNHWNGSGKTVYTKNIPASDIDFTHDFTLSDPTVFGAPASMGDKWASASSRGIAIGSDVQATGKAIGISCANADSLIHSCSWRYVRNDSFYANRCEDDGTVSSEVFWGYTTNKAEGRDTLLPYDANRIPTVDGASIGLLTGVTGSGENSSHISGASFGAGSGLSVSGASYGIGSDITSKNSSIVLGTDSDGQNNSVIVGHHIHPEWNPNNPTDGGIVAIGLGNTVSSGSISVGSNGNVAKDGSVSIGTSSSATSGSVAVGKSNVSSSGGSAVFGQMGTNADGHSVALGLSNSAKGCGLSLGLTGNVRAESCAVSIGGTEGNVISYGNAIAIGMGCYDNRDNVQSHSTTNVNATDRSAVFGFGEVQAARNAMVVGKDDAFAADGGMLFGRTSYIKNHGMGFGTGLDTDGGFAFGCGMSARTGGITIGTTSVASGGSIYGTPYRIGNFSNTFVACSLLAYHNPDGNWVPLFGTISPVTGTVTMASWFTNVAYNGNTYDYIVISIGGSTSGDGRWWDDQNQQWRLPLNEYDNSIVFSLQTPIRGYMHTYQDSNNLTHVEFLAADYRNLMDFNSPVVKNWMGVSVSTFERNGELYVYAPGLGYDDETRTDKIVPFSSQNIENHSQNWTREVLGYTGSNAEERWKDDFSWLSTTCGTTIGGGAAHHSSFAFGNCTPGSIDSVYLKSYMHSIQYNGSLNGLPSTLTLEKVSLADNASLKISIRNGNTSNGSSILIGQANNTAVWSSIVVGLENNYATGSSFAGGMSYNSADNASLAFGSSNTAHGRSFAIGGTNAAMCDAVTFGRDNIATESSVALGIGSKSSNNSVVLGHYAESNRASVAVGFYATASNNSTAVGQSAKATSSGSAFGNYSIAAEYGVALGRSNIAFDAGLSAGHDNATTDTAIAIGQSNMMGGATIAIGESNSYITNAGALGLAIGQRNTIGDGGYNISLGQDNTAKYGAIAMGLTNSSSGWSFLAGSQNSTDNKAGAHAIIFGALNISRANLQSIRKQNLLPGVESTTFAPFSFILGSANEANHYNSILIGAVNKSLAPLGGEHEPGSGSTEDSTDDDGFVLAIGLHNTVGRNYDIAIGRDSVANGGENLAINTSTALGYHNVSLNQSSINMGTYNLLFSSATLQSTLYPDWDWAHHNIIDSSLVIFGTEHTETPQDRDDIFTHNRISNAHVNAVNTKFHNNMLYGQVGRNSSNEYNFIGGVRNNSPTGCVTTNKFWHSTVNSTGTQFSESFIDFLNIVTTSGNITRSDVRFMKTEVGYSSPLLVMNDSDIEDSRVEHAQFTHGQPNTMYNSSSIIHSDILHSEFHLDQGKLTNTFVGGNSFVNLSGTAPKAFVSSWIYGESTVTISRNTGDDVADCSRNMLFSTQLVGAAHGCFLFGGLNERVYSVFNFSDKYYEGKSRVSDSDNVVNFFDNVTANTHTALVLGASNTVDSSFNAIVIGEKNVASKTYLPVIFGIYNTVTNTSSVPDAEKVNNFVFDTANTLTDCLHTFVAGQENNLTSASETVVFGRGNQITSAEGSNVFGAGNTIEAYSNRPFVFGDNNTISTVRPFVMGNNNNAVQPNVVTSLADNHVANQFIVGAQNTVTGSEGVAIGLGHSCIGSQSVAIGGELKSNKYQTVIGHLNAELPGPDRFNLDDQGATIDQSDKALFIIGNGQADGYETSDFVEHWTTPWATGDTIEDHATRSNAMVVWGDGTIESKNLPKPPTTDGTYTLTCTVTNGVPTYSWA